MEMLHSLLSHAGELHRAELLFRAAVGATSTTFTHEQGRSDFLLWIIWGFLQSLLGCKETWLFHLNTLQMLESLSLHWEGEGAAEGRGCSVGLGLRLGFLCLEGQGRGVH